MFDLIREEALEHYILKITTFVNSLHLVKIDWPIFWRVLQERFRKCLSTVKTWDILLTSSWTLWSTDHNNISITLLKICGFLQTSDGMGEQMGEISILATSVPRLWNWRTLRLRGSDDSAPIFAKHTIIVENSDGPGHKKPIIWNGILHIEFMLSCCKMQKKIGIDTTEIRPPKVKKIEGPDGSMQLNQHNNI